jgi:hypothetical protein
MAKVGFHERILLVLIVVIRGDKIQQVNPFVEHHKCSEENMSLLRSSESLLFLPLLTCPVKLG